MDPAWRGAGKTRSATGPTYTSMQEGISGPIEPQGRGGACSGLPEGKRSSGRPRGLRPAASWTTAGSVSG